MNLDFSNYKPRLFVMAVGALWAGASAVLSKLWGHGAFHGVGPTAIVFAVLIAYDKWAWRWPIFSLLTTATDLAGVYEGHIHFTRNDQTTAKQCRMHIKQSLSRIKVTCDFTKAGDPDTTSVSEEALLRFDDHGDHQLIFIYRNEGSNLSGDSLGEHQGTNVLTVIRALDGIRLRGFYYTNREPQTKGRIEVRRLPKA